MSNAQTAPAPAMPMTPAIWGLLLLLGSIWGGSFFFARIAVQEIPPLALVLFRVSIAATALLAYTALRGISLAPVIRRWRLFALLSLVNNIIPFSLMFFGQTELGAGLASVINATTPFWTILVAGALTADERITGVKMAGVLLGIAGTAMMIGPGMLAGLGGPAWAKFALLGMALSYAFAFLVARRLRDVPPVVTATGQLSVSTILMVPVVLALHGVTGLFDAGPAAWAAVLGLALLATAFAYIIYFRLVAEAGATNASLVTLIVPVSGLLLGALFLGERLEPFEFAGMALIGLGLLVIDGRLLRRLARRTADAAAHK